MREWLERVRQWFARHKKTLDLFPAYVGAVYHAWHDYLWGWTPVAPIIVWWMLGATANVDRRSSFHLGVPYCQLLRAARGSTAKIYYRDLSMALATWC